MVAKTPQQYDLEGIESTTAAATSSSVRRPKSGVHRPVVYA